MLRLRRSTSIAPWRNAASTVVALWACSVSPLHAQAPLMTDDAAVAGRRVLHVELFGQFAQLPASVRPATRQNTFVLTAGSGVTDRLEVGFDFPYIAIQRGGRFDASTGDLNLTAKYLLIVPADSMRARMALGVAVELPTGDAERGFGSGVTDYGFNLIGEWRTLIPAVVRVNGGVQVAGNTLTGLIGIRDRGVVLSSAASVSRALNRRLCLAGEVSGYQGRSPAAADRELRMQGALLVSVAASRTLALGVQRGWLASPPWIVQFGGSLDW